jgi:hypothetical protein
MECGDLSPLFVLCQSLGYPAKGWPRTKSCDESQHSKASPICLIHNGFYLHKLHINEQGKAAIIYESDRSD